MPWRFRLVERQRGYIFFRFDQHQGSGTARRTGSRKKSYYLRGDPKERAPGDQHRTTPNAHLTAPWPMELGWGVSGDNLSAAFMPRLCVYGR